MHLLLFSFSSISSGVNEKKIFNKKNVEEVSTLGTSTFTFLDNA